MADETSEAGRVSVEVNGQAVSPSKPSPEDANDSAVELNDGVLNIRVGSGGVGSAMMQMNRVHSLAIDAAGLEIKIGSSGVGSAMMQMNRVHSLAIDVAGLDINIGSTKSE